MLVLCSLAILLTVHLPQFATGQEDCSAISCLIPLCKVTHVPPGKCCPICGPAPCAIVRCAKPNCSHGWYTPVGKCCPICKDKPGKCPPVKPIPKETCALIRLMPCKQDGDCMGVNKCCRHGCGLLACMAPIMDCSAVLCLKPLCKVTHVPPGKCCPICGPDCSKVLCPLIKCPFGFYTPEGECCPTCKPDCTNVPCPAIGCLYGSYVPEGKCCKVCKQDCTRILCRQRSCRSGSFTPEGQCCPICKTDCLDFICPKINCLPGESYIPFGQCCPACFQPDCSNVVCPAIKCMYGSYKPDGKCCPVCKTEKPGKCPNVTGQIGICIQACSGDSSCPDDQKCCSNGCGNTCQTPAIDCSLVKCAKPVCPNGHFIPAGKCCPECNPVTCPNGQNGTCGTIAGLQCPDGAECIYEGSFPDAAGKCCIKNPKPTSVCHESLKIGPCRAAIPRYFYNKTSCRCEFFSWGGCQPNGNNFLNLAYCQASCEVPMQSNPVCKLDKYQGYCKFSWNIDRWRFNRFTCKCEMYKWHGCGNANNFVSKELCESNCGCYDCEPNTDICDLPIKPDGGGPVVCLAYIPSYGYNTKTCRCEKFIYSGCGGNENRFASLALCERRCGNNTCEAPVSCDQPADKGSCDDKITRYFFNNKTCKCEKFIWTGCGGNSNNFKTSKECMRSCKGEPCGKPKPNCLLPKVIGPCEALVKRYYFDKVECKCKMFNYGGCGGNSNNFPTLKKCKKSCRDTTCPVCNLPAEPGPCRATMERFFYNIMTCRCEKFIYGGCKGNGNRYETKSECENMCGSYPCVTNCLEPKKVGPCKGAIKRFYYNPLSNKCEKFSWGGCQPNGNNFESKKFCNKVCKNAVCSLPKIIGPCKALVKRYYYNSNTKQCEEFYWGGCQSNGNNFKTEKACRKKCS